MSIRLKNERLCVEITEPKDIPPTNLRFDRAGFITQVTLDGTHQFCAREPQTANHKNTGGRGLASEYVFDAPSEEAPIGGYFIKPGVGLLKKYEDAPYHIFKDYEFKPIGTAWSQPDEQSVSFATAPVPCLGYEFCTKKDLHIDGNCLFMDITVENESDRPMAIEEFDHNFVTVDFLPTGPGCTLTMPVAPQDAKRPKNGTLTGHGNTFSFTGYTELPSRVDVAENEIDHTVPFVWELRNRLSPAFIRGETSFAPSRVTVWCIYCIASPEVYIKTQIAPHSSRTWRRKWTFGD